MANDEHVAMLRKGVAAWNEWRDQNASIQPDLAGADLFGANLIGADLRSASLTGACLIDTDLSKALLSRAVLLRAICSSETDFSGARLVYADLSGLNLNGVRFIEANLNGASLRGANLIGANFYAADLVRADLTAADLTGASLQAARLMNTEFSGANLTGCRVYGVSAWNLKLHKTKQQDLVITRQNEPTLTVDNIEVAQFIYLMVNNQKVRDVIDTITSKAVLILGRFTDERKAVLDALREELRKRDYLPILFDFDVPATRDISETVSLLARMARFIIADLTDPSSIPKELEAIVPGLAVPVQPLLLGNSSRPYAMFRDYWKYDWVLPVYRYEGLEQLLAAIADEVIAPAEGKVKALQERRRMIEEELVKPR